MQPITNTGITDEEMVAMGLAPAPAQPGLPPIPVGGSNLSGPIGTGIQLESIGPMAKQTQPQSVAAPQRTPMIYDPNKIMNQY